MFRTSGRFPHGSLREPCPCLEPDFTANHKHVCGRTHHTNASCTSLARHSSCSWHAWNNNMGFLVVRGRGRFGAVVRAGRNRPRSTSRAWLRSAAIPALDSPSSSRLPRSSCAGSGEKGLERVSTGVDIRGAPHLNGRPRLLSHSLGQHNFLSALVFDLAQSRNTPKGKLSKFLRRGCALSS